MTATPTIKWTDKGLIAPKEPDILSGRLTDFDNAFGGNLNTTNLESPQGQIASSDAVIIGEINDAILSLANQVDPRFASGFMQDAIGQIYFIERKPATATKVLCTISGAADEIIPAGALAKDTNGNVYQNINDVQVQLSGTVLAEFENIVKGAIPAPIGTVTLVYDRQGALGWESITNLVDGELGQELESRADFEARRNASVFIGSDNTLDSAYSAIFDIAKVTDVYATQNLTASDLTIGATGYVLHPHEIFICVRGGTNLAVAKAIYSKILGSTLVGNTSIDVRSAITGQLTTITFNRPTPYAIKFAVNIVNSPLLPGNAIDLVKQAIIDAFNGADGGEKARIGQTIFASRFYQSVVGIDSNVKLISLHVGNTTANLDSISIGIDNYPSLSISNITVNLI